MSDGGTIDVWFDANCPFTWRTAKWLRDSAGRRGVRLRWHLMSLYKLNEGEDLEPERREKVDRTRLAMRVLAAVEDKDADQVEPVYFAIGRHLHDADEEVGRPVLEASLIESGLPADLAAAADDESWDSAVFASHAEGQAAVGEDSGSPVLSVNGAQAFFGPVLTSVPGGADALRLLDGFMGMASVAEFTELKRSRDGCKPVPA